MDIQTYFQRINYHGPLAPTAETLRELHVAHLLAVPFENLNIGLGWPIVLDEAALFEKIVVRRRGGFCYELNGLFSALLRALSFDVTLLSAGVARADGGFGPEFDHLTLLV
ncbi:MAG TPA: arylamine N-acetyltransferase, partial [Roseiflexaceae bacterium]